MTRNAFRIINGFLVVCFALVLSAVSYTIFQTIYNTQNSAYIDEIFHIPQAKRYCRDEWTKWDPKITTLPGLYVVSYSILKPLGMFWNENLCSTYGLRFTNLLATILNFLLAYKILGCLDKKYKKGSKFMYKLFTSLNVAIFPPLYFFTFLFYTDVWSTTFVFLLYYLHLSGGKFSKVLGFYAGFMAVLMRQTNVIWVGLMIIDDAWNVLSQNHKTVTVQDYKFSKEVFRIFFYNYLHLRNFIKLVYTIMSKSFHNIAICILFISFVLINKSIVLGDKEAHTATFHPMQNLYFLDFVAFFGFPFLILEVASVWRKPINIFLIIFLMGLSAGLSETNKLEHPYLLADNRHLAFYLWKRIFGHPLLRRLIIPTYACSGVLLWRLLQKRCHFMFMVMLSACTILNLTPQYLFELRYFIIPFLFWRFQFRESRAVFLETVFFVFINYGVIYLFLNRPFVWVSEPGVKQRFIW